MRPRRRSGPTGCHWHCPQPDTRYIGAEDRQWHCPQTPTHATSVPRIVSGTVRRPRHTLHRCRGSSVALSADPDTRYIGAEARQRHCPQPPILATSVPRIVSGTVRSPTHATSVPRIVSGTVRRPRHTLHRCRGSSVALSAARHTLHRCRGSSVALSAVPDIRYMGMILWKTWFIVISCSSALLSTSARSDACLLLVVLSKAGQCRELRRIVSNSRCMWLWLYTRRGGSIRLRPD